MSVLELLPAIDVTDGQAVRLSSGSVDAGSWGSPIDVARSFDEAGARWVHLVDLDLAFGRGDNSALLARVISEVPVRVELSGGITSRAAIEAGLAMGPERVNVATQALERIDEVCEAIDAFGERVAVCLDVRGDRLSARGAAREGGNVWEALRVLNEAGVARLVVTDVTRDGQMNGSNRELLARVADQTPALIIASGGVNSLADIEALRALGIEDVQTVDPHNAEAVRSALKEATHRADDLSVIVFRAPCVLLERKRKPAFEVTSACTGCGVCATLGCPAISKDAETGVAFVDASLCIGCGQCAQYCKFGALVSTEA